MSIIMTLSCTAAVGVLATAAMCRLVLQIMPKKDV